jgi:hypothetical protein
MVMTMKSNILAIFSVLTIATLMLMCTTPTVFGESTTLDNAADAYGTGQAASNTDQADDTDYVPTDDWGYYVATGVTSMAAGAAAGIGLGILTGVGIATKLTAAGAGVAVAGTLGTVAGVLTGVGILASVVMLGFMILSWCL